MNIEAFKEEFKALLEKYDASICIVTEGEGYSMTMALEISIGNTFVMETNEEITQHTFND